MLAESREPQPDQNVETREQVDRLIEALDTLETPLRSVILLRDIQGLDYQEIATVLSLPLGTVKSRLFRARLALRAAMDGAPGAVTASDLNEADDV